MHWTYCAQTRYGKSEYLRKLILRTAGRRDCTCVLVDPAGTLARQLVVDFDFIGRRDVMYIRLSDTDRTVGFDWVVPSTNPDPYKRRAQNEDRRDRLKSIMLFRRGMLQTTRTPIIEVGLNAALDLKFNQDRPSPDYWVLRAFEPFSDEQTFLVQHCILESIVQRFEAWNYMHPSRRRDETGPAERVLEGFFGKTAVQVHTGATFDLRVALNSRSIILVDGDDISDDTASVMEMAIIHKVVQECREGLDCPVFLSVDEATGLTDAMLSKQLREIGKHDCSLHLSFQNPLDFASSEIRNNVFQNSYHWWGRQGNPDAAQFATEDIATCLLDPNLVWFKEYRLRQIHDGYSFEKMRSITKSDGRESETEGERALGRYSDRPEEVTHRKDYTMQEKEIKKRLMGLGPGWHYFRDEKVSPEPVCFEMEPEPWSECPGLPDKMLAKAIAKIKSKGCYRTPVLLSPPSPPKKGRKRKGTPLDDLEDGGTVG